MGVEDLDIKLLVSSDTLTPALNKLNTSIGALTDKLETATVKERSFGDAGVDASDRISTSTDSLKDVYTEFNSKLELVRKGFEMLKKAAEMAAQAMGELTQQAQLDRLAEVVEIETLTHRVEELANRQSDLTRFSREQTREIAATFVQATIGLRLTMPQIEEGIRLTQDLMEATGRSGREAASVVARIYAGNLESINELLPGQRTHLNLLRREAEMRDRIALEQSGYNQYQQEYLALLQEQDRAIELSVAGLETLQTAYSGAAEAIDPIEQEIQQVTNELAEFRDELIRLALQQESESVRNYSRAMRALSVDLRGTAVFGAIGAQRLGDHRAGVVARQHDDAAQQVLDRNPVGGVQKHGRAAIGHGVLRHGQFLDQVEPAAFLAAFHRLERHIERHQLGHGGGRQRFVRVLGQKHGAGGLVKDVGGRGFGIKGEGRKAEQDQRQAGSNVADHGRGLLL